MKRILPDNNLVPDFEYIARGLARQIRFGGHSLHVYSVLAHTLVVTNFVPKEYRIFAMLHDAPEAVMGDTPRPWKSIEQCRLEDTLLERITRSCGLPWPWPERIAKAVYDVDDAAGIAESHVIEFYDGTWDDNPRQDIMDATHKMLMPSAMWVTNPELGINNYVRIIKDAFRDWQAYRCLTCNGVGESCLDCEGTGSNGQ